MLLPLHGTYTVSNVPDVISHVFSLTKFFVISIYFFNVHHHKLSYEHFVTKIHTSIESVEHTLFVRDVTCSEKRVTLES